MMDDVDSKIDKPWERLDWSPEKQLGIFRDWGFFYNQRILPAVANENYNKALELDPKNVKLLQYRSKCKRDMAQIESALDDSVKAWKINPRAQPIALEVCDALYELNHFENTKRKLHNNTAKFTGYKVRAFYKRLDVVDENFKDILGKSLTPFILKNDKVFPIILDEIYKRSHKDPRPLWKILREQGKCDVESIIEKPDELLSPREKARRERAFNVFNQIYCKRTWIDVLFLKLMKSNKNFWPEYQTATLPALRNMITSNYVIITKFLKMLQSRSPMYHERFLKCPNKAMCKRYLEGLLFRIQNQTRRNMLSILRGIRIMRAAGKLEKLCKFVEDVMGNYVVLKTHRVMPWKMEFVNEVYNTVALAYADCFIKSPYTKTQYCSSDLIDHMRTDVDLHINRAVKFVFGCKTVNNVDVRGQRYKLAIAQMERRMHFVQYNIERTYLYHEIARTYLQLGHFEECCSVARRGSDVAMSCNSYIWAFLNTMLIAKAHAILHKIERCKDVLTTAYKLAVKLHSPELCSFIVMCLAQNEKLLIKKKRQSGEFMRKRSKHSLKASSISLSLALREDT